MKFIAAMGYALNGIRHCFLKTTNFRIQLILMCMTISMGFLFSISASEWCALVICFSLVLSLEMVNTALEETCNLISPSIHPAVKHIKDTAAGAVLMASVSSAITGALIFFPKIIMKLNL